MKRKTKVAIEVVIGTAFFAGAVIFGLQFWKASDNQEKGMQKTAEPTKEPTKLQKTTEPTKEPTKLQKTAEPTKEPTKTEKQECAQENFYISEIPDSIFEKMQGKSFKSECTVARDELRYVHVLHMGFDGKTKEGELIVNVTIAQDVLEIFQELYKEKYPIEKIRLVDEYDADDERSMRDNNSSAFNFRFISHTKKISKHGLGLAIDINPLYNPYIKRVDGKKIVEPANAEPYTNRTTGFSYKIDHDDLCYKLFTEHGFSWGGDWKRSKDYQHFEK